MKLVATTVGFEGYGEEGWNQDRLINAEQAITNAVELGAELSSNKIAFCYLYSLNGCQYMKTISISSPTLFNLTQRTS